MTKKADTEGPSGQSGIQMHEAHFPSRAPIDSYGNGGFRFAGMSHRGAILCLPSGIYEWNVSAPSDLNDRNFRKILAESDAIEILLIGSGVDLHPIDNKLRQVFRQASISADAMSTGAAVRTFNVLLAEGRAVGAALLPVA